MGITHTDKVCVLNNQLLMLIYIKKVRSSTEVMIQVIVRARLLE